MELFRVMHGTVTMRCGTSLSRRTRRHRLFSTAASCTPPFWTAPGIFFPGDRIQPGLPLRRDGRHSPREIRFARHERRASPAEPDPAGHAAVRPDLARLRHRLYTHALQDRPPFSLNSPRKRHARRLWRACGRQGGRQRSAAPRGPRPRALKAIQHMQEGITARR